MLALNDVVLKTVDTGHMEDFRTTVDGIREYPRRRRADRGHRHRLHRLCTVLRRPHHSTRRRGAGHRTHRSHTLSDRPLVVKSSSRIEVTVALRPGSRDAQVTCDGEILGEMGSGETLDIRAAKETVPASCTPGGRTTTSSWRSKLNWGRPTVHHASFRRRFVLSLISSPELRRHRRSPGRFQPRIERAHRRNRSRQVPSRRCPRARAGGPRRCRSRALREPWSRDQRALRVPARPPGHPLAQRARVGGRSMLPVAAGDQRAGTLPRVRQQPPGDAPGPAGGGSLLVNIHGQSAHQALLHGPGPSADRGSPRPPRRPWPRGSPRLSTLGDVPVGTRGSAAARIGSGGRTGDVAVSGPRARGPGLSGRRTRLPRRGPRRLANVDRLANCLTAC